MSAITLLERGPTKGIQIYQQDTQSIGECWKAVPHKSAQLQCTGEAQYIDDLPPFKGTHCMAGSVDRWTTLLYMTLRYNYYLTDCMNCRDSSCVLAHCEKTTFYKTY